MEGLHHLLIFAAGVVVGLLVLVVYSFAANAIVSRRDRLERDRWKEESGV